MNRLKFKLCAYICLKKQLNPILETVFKSVMKEWCIVLISSSHGLQNTLRVHLSYICIYLFLTSQVLF